MAKNDAAERLAALDAVIGALAHPARRQILFTIHLRDGQMTAGDIAGRFRHSWPTTTRHLRVLEEAGLVTVEASGRTRVYRTNIERLRIVRQWLDAFE
ncbi:MAG TPA: metalloregulator ArsR/SmtB family transcription factor [Thermoanaerobaculia bacterium]|nr:metalloregulator ArsR/SmtB family transcription factor [Thermoanaerobaculia bacterium]